MAEPSSEAEPSEPSEPPPPAQRRRRRWPVIVGAIILIPLLMAAGYTALVLTWSYSDGDRSGTLYKFSRKGWFCKTWEGELNITPTAAAPTIWRFTVRDDDVVRQMNQMLGMPVVVHYREHRGVPTSCFGETPYFADDVKIMGR